MLIALSEEIVRRNTQIIRTPYKTEYGEVAELVDAIYIVKTYHFCDTNSKQHTRE